MKKTKKSDKSISKQFLTVPVAELKARLSMYLKLAKSGKDVVVTDHNTPVARVVSFVDSSFVIQEAKFKLLNLIRFAALPATGKTDSLELLMEERGKR